MFQQMMKLYVKENRTVLSFPTRTETMLAEQPLSRRLQWLRVQSLGVDRAVPGGRLSGRTGAGSTSCPRGKDSMHMCVWCRERSRPQTPMGARWRTVGGHKLALAAGTWGRLAEVPEAFSLVRLNPASFRGPWPGARC